jgi:ElaB/YqjD/DUF883 family membrane-anchored ribosome-binding protein
MNPQLALLFHAINTGCNTSMQTPSTSPDEHFAHLSAPATQLANELPDWFRFLDAEDGRRYLRYLQDYDQSRAALLSVLGGAASPEQFASVRLRVRIANDLGYDIDPEHLIVSTWRNLPLTNEPYKVSRPLHQLALYGLHPGDMNDGSVFLKWSTLTLQGQPLGSAYPKLTNHYLGALIEELNLRSSFAPMQREAYESALVQRLMAEVTRQQVMVQAYAAKLQGQILPADFELIETLTSRDSGTPAGNASVQQLKLNQRDLLSNVLLFRKEDAVGQVERLILFTPDIPRGCPFKPFDNQRQLLHELVSWSGFPEMRSFLLNHVQHASRAALQTQLNDLDKKPYPAANFLTLVTQKDYEEGLRTLVTEQVNVILSEQSQHTPDWYLRASRQQRQQLVALEDAFNAARQAYQDKTHAQVQAFDDYVHQRASQKINALLGLAEGTVDPDTIIITSEREKLSYTQMLLNGYNDSFNPISESPRALARFSGPAGIDLTSLTAEKVARSVHGKWLSDDYVAQVRNTLLNANSTGYTYRRRASLLITQLHMSAAALRSQLKGEISAQQYAWLKASIEQMHVSEESTRQRYPIYPLQFTLHNPLIATNVPVLGEVAKLFVDSPQERVLGCYLLTPNHPGNPQHALIYTPNAPDGLQFRPLSSFVNTLKHDGMSDYYKDRCRIKENRKLAFFLADMKAGGNSQPPVLPSAALPDLYDSEFNAVIERNIRDIEDTTTGRSDMLEKLAWTSIELIVTAVTLPFPPASFAVGMLLAFRDSAHALNALSEGDREAASGYILSSLLNSLGAAGDWHSGLKGFGGILRHVTHNAGQNSLLRTVKQLRNMSPALKDLRPLQLHGESFWAAKPGLSGHAPLYRGSQEKLVATGHFAEKNIAGTWQPLRRETSTLPSTSPGKANPAYAVDISLQGTTPIARGHARGVTRIQGQHYVEVDGLTFAVQYDSRLRYWSLIDHDNPFAFFGKQPVRLNDQGQWQVIDRLNLRGGVGPSYHALNDAPAGSSTAIAGVSDYELPPHLQTHMHGIVDPTYVDALVDHGLVSSGDMAKFYGDMRTTYSGLRQNLYRDALAFFEHPSLAAKPVLPAIEASTKVDTLIKDIFANTNGLVIGEAPASIASKQLLIDNMALLAEQKVEVLYLQHLLTDQHLDKLSKYKKLGNTTKAGSNVLKYFFNGVNGGALRNASKIHDYHHLVKTAHRYNIEVKPLSSSVSYSFVNNPLPAAGDDAAAQKMSGFFAHKVISADTAAEPQRRWVALVDQHLANTYQDLPGITELHGAISIRVKDVAAGSPRRLSRDAGGSIAGKPIAKGDFRLEMANPALTELPAPSPAAIPEASQYLDDALYQLMEGKPNTLGKRRNPYSGEHGFKLNEAGEWQRVDPTQWKADESPTAIQQSLIDLEYEMPLELRVDLHELANFQNRGLDHNYHVAEPRLAQARRMFFHQRQQLQADARRIMSIELPPRPTLPDVSPEMTPSGFLDSLYEHSAAVVIGESHASVASKKLIIDNLPHLAEREVKTLYLEHLLTDLHQADLDRFVETGHMSKSLLHALRKLDRGHLTDPDKIYTFEKLVIAAQEQGLEIRAIDCAASYHLKHLPTQSPTTRQQMMNFFASRTIRKHQEVMGAHKWIALVGNSHANTFEKTVPGIAELEQGIGVRVVGVGPGQAGVARDSGEILIRGMGEGQAFIQSDYRMALDTLATPAARKTVEVRLQRPGMFLIDESQAGQSLIVHRSRDNSIQRTPILSNGEGMLYIERESWESIHLQPYADLSALREALEGINLTRVG